jgi:hypothetical protein
VSTLHEVLVGLFRSRPSLVAWLMADPLDVELPDWKGARLEPGRPDGDETTQYQADAVVALSVGQRPEPEHRSGSPL